jgi:hypothetical protein
MIFSFTHTQEIPWMLPGIAPTNRLVEVPLVTIVRFRARVIRHQQPRNAAKIFKGMQVSAEPGG